MGRLLLSLTLATGSVLQPLLAQDTISPTVDNPRPAQNRSEMLAYTLWRAAVAAHVRIGFEAVEEVKMLTVLNETPSLGNGTLKEALDAAMAMDGRYDWREADGVFVVRPKTAWSDSVDPLNRPVRNLQITDVPLNDVITGIANVIYAGRFVVSGRASNSPASFRIDSGTVIDVLNRLITSSQQTMWAVYVGQVIRDNNGRSDLISSINVVNDKHPTGFSGGHRAPSRDRIF